VVSWYRGWNDYYGDRFQWHIGDTTNEDDPRGREFGAHIELGIATGQFDHVGWDGKTYPKPEYGSWGAWVQLWHWGVSLTIRGPVLGHYPPEEDE
jgi:hypothetical protein